MGAITTHSVGGRSLCDTRLSVLSQELEGGGSGIGMRRKLAEFLSIFNLSQFQLNQPHLLKESDIVNLWQR